jgi:hypothetical protein
MQFCIEYEARERNLEVAKVRSQGDVFEVP